MPLRFTLTTTMDYPSWAEFESDFWQMNWANTTEALQKLAAGEVVSLLETNRLGATALTTAHAEEVEI